MILDSMAVAGGVIAVLLCCSAFFSASEIAIFSLERHRIAALASGPDPDGAALARLREDPHRLLVTILVGNNVVNITMASLATATLAAAYGPGAGVTIATAAMSVLILVVGEIAPKSYGVANAERIALLVARPIAVFERVISPVVTVFEGVVSVLDRLTGSQPAAATELTRAELERLIATGEDVGAIDDRERRMVQGVFDLETTSVREVLVPRPNVIAVAETASLSAIVGLCADERVTRVPVYRDSLDDVVGIVDVRDAERALREGLSLADVLREPVIVPDSRRVDALLAELQTRRSPMAVVVNEYGETEGIVTIEDVLEEIVGEIAEVGEPRSLRHTDDGLLVNGEVTVGEVNDALGIELPRAGDYETIAGLVTARLGRLGEVGDVVAVPEASVSIAVEATDRNRIEQVRVRRDDAAPAGSTHDESET
ncbi:hemolysin family protein [Halopenitus sp. POP-27]|uniref:hemolysin family protein n=1 Tax=Halopenitus sp. POP-27 TaxID=2994425 RepID=UPI002469257A|nr:hemolysin family protein [Halopenitus sp. POP-27]